MSSARGGGRGSPGKGLDGGAGKRGPGGGRAEASSGLKSEKTRERTARAGPARTPRYLQRSSRTLPGISTRFVSMMRTHSRSSASRLRAAGDEGAVRRLRLAGERAARRRRQRLREREGEGAKPAHFRPAPSARDPPRLGRGGGGAPGATPRFYLNGPMGSWRIGSLSA